MSINLLANSSIVLLIANLALALSPTLAFGRACRVRALGAPRAHVLHARAAEPPRRAPGLCLPAGPRPGLAHSPELARPPLEPHSAAVRSAMVASGRPQQAPAMDGAARAALARQLAPGAVPARPLASAAIPSLDTSRCKLQNGGSPFLSTAADDLIHGRRGTDLARL